MSYVAGGQVGSGLVWHGGQQYVSPKPGELAGGGVCFDPSSLISERWFGALHGFGNQIARVLSRVVPQGFYWYVKHLQVSHNDVNAHSVKAFLIPPLIVFPGAIGDGERIPLVAHTNIAGFVGPTEGAQIPPSDPTSVLSQGGTTIGQMNTNGLIVPSRWALFGLVGDVGSANDHRMIMSAVFFELSNNVPVPTF